MEVYSAQEIVTFMQITQTNGILRLVCAIICFIIAITSMSRRREIKGFKDIVYVAIAMGFWNLMLCLYWLVNDLKMLPWFDASLYIGLAFSPYFLFRYCLDYCFPAVLHKKRNRLLMNLLAIIPSITVILALTFPLHDLFMSYDINDIWYSPCREIRITYGKWFYLHLAISYFLMLATATLFLIKCFHKETRNRVSCIIVSLAITGFAVQNFVSSFFILENYHGYISVFFHMWCINSFFWTSYFDHDETVSFFAKTELFENIGFPLFVFNNNDELILANSYGTQFLNDMNHPFEKYDTYKNIFTSALFLEQGTIFNSENNRTFFLQNRATGIIFYTQQSGISTNTDKSVGYVITCYNMSKLNSYVRELEITSEIDSLCQCRTKLLYDKKRKEIMLRMHKPVGVLCANLDGLKSVNDVHGHEAGDEYLRTAASVLKKITCSAENMFRLDGDTFMIFIEKHDEIDLKNIQVEIADECKKISTPYPFGISTGFSIVSDKDINYEKNFKQAEENMKIAKKDCHGR